VKWPITAEEFYKGYLEPCRPVIIEVPGGLSTLGWNTSNWTEDYLISKVGDLMINVEKKITDEGFGRRSDKLQMPFPEFLGHIFHANLTDPNRDLYYLNLQNIEFGSIVQPPLTLLSEDWYIPPFFLSRPTTAANLWIGASDPTTGSKSGLHHDYGDNLYVLIKGRKKVRLFSPADSFNVYPMGTINYVTKNGQHSFCWHPDNHWSQLNLNLPEEQVKAQWPRYSDANPLECTVEEGEMLFIPNGWWHQVTSYGIHMAINVWTFPIRLE